MIKDSCRICKHRWICKVAEHLDLARREFSGKYMAWQTLDKLMDELKEKIAILCMHYERDEEHARWLETPPRRDTEEWGFS